MPTPTRPARAPLPVLLAAGVLAAQGAALIGFSGWLLVRRMDHTPSNEQVFEGATVYLALSGALVVLIAMALRSARGWSLAAAVVVQLIALGVAYEMATAGFWAGAVPLGLVAVAVIAALLARSSRTALGRGEVL